MPKPVKNACRGEWWDASEDAITEPEYVEVELSYEEGFIYIDGLRDGKSLSVPLKAVGRAIADGN